MALAAVTGVAAASTNTALIDPGQQNYGTVNVGATSDSGIRINTNRDIEERQNGSYTDQADWLSSGASSSDYQVMFSQVSGDTLSGNSLGVYHALSASREVYVATSTPGAVAANVDVTIRRIASPGDSVTFTVTLSAVEDVPI